MNSKTLLLLTALFSLSFLCFARSGVSRGLKPFTEQVDTDAISDSFSESFENDTYISFFKEFRLTMAEKLMEFNRFSRRFIYFTNNNTLEEVPSTFCLPEDVLNGTSGPDKAGPDDFEDCQWYPYAESLGLVSAIMLVVGFLIFPCLQFWCLTIRCCSCKMLKPHKGCCCGEYEDFDPEKDGYSKGTVGCTFCAALVFFLVLSAGTAVGIYNHLQVNQDVVDFIGFTNDTLDTASRIITVVNDTMTNISNQYPEYVPFDISGIADTFNETLSMINGYKDIGIQYIDMTILYRDIITYLTYCFPLLLALMVLFARCCGWGCGCPMISLGYLTTLVFLLLFSLFFPVSTAISDACVFANAILNESKPEYKKDIADFFVCSPDTPLVNVTKAVRDSMDSVVDTVCDEIKNIESFASVPCDRDKNNRIADGEVCQIVTAPPYIGKCGSRNLAHYLGYNFTTYEVGCYFVNDISHEIQGIPGSCGNLNIHDVYATDNCSALYPTYPNSMSMYCGQGNGTYRILHPEEVDLIQDPLIAANFSKLSRMLNAGIDLLNVYINEVYPYLRCQTIVNVTNYARELVCVGALGSSSLFYIAAAIAALGTFGATVTAVYAIKRFKKGNKQGDAPMSDPESAEMESLADTPSREKDIKLMEEPPPPEKGLDEVYSDGCLSPPPM